MTEPTDTIDLSSETHDKLVPVYDGFWLAATKHHPGGGKKMPEINNRCIVLKLEENGEPILAVFNAVDVGVMAEVRRIEVETGLKVKHIVSPGGGHHLTMPDWHDEFTDATVHLCPIRAPRTMNCAELVKSERVNLMDENNPLPQFAGQIDAVVFTGLLGFPDVKSPHEGAKENFIGMMKMMMMMMKGPKDPVDELWFHHIPSGTVVGGENLGWMFTPEDFERLPGMFKKMMQADAVYLPSMGRKVGDASIVAKKWERILGWPARTLISYHDTPTYAWTDDPQKALAAAVDAEGQR